MEPSYNQVPWKPRLPSMSPVRAFATIFMAVFLFIFLGSALVTYILPETFVAVTRVRVDSPETARQFQASALLVAAGKQLDLPATYAARYGQADPLTDEDLLNRLRRSVQISVLRPPGLLEVRAYGPAPNECARLANAIAETGTAQLGGSPPKVEIVDRAVTPARAVRPNVVLNLTLGAIVGAFLGTMAGGVGAKLAVGFDGKGRGDATGEARV